MLMEDARSLVVERRVSVAPARAFRAWTDAAEVRRWWRPMGSVPEEIAIDLRIGGRFRFALRSPQGNAFVAQGVYTAIEAPHRLAHTWVWDHIPDLETRVSVEFRADGAGTRVVLRHDGFPDAETAMRHREGWTSVLDYLETYRWEDSPAAEITLYGFDMSTFVRTARMACLEKGVAHALEPVELHAPSHRALHPFGRMPAMRHGDYRLYETRAIAAYVDAAFPGPALTPADARGRAEMEKWISISNAYVDPTTTRSFLFERLAAPKVLGRPADEGLIAGALPHAAEQLALMDAELATRTWLAGESFSIADLFLAPIVAYVEAAPEGPGLLDGRGNVRRWLRAVAGRPSFAATAPHL